MEDRTRRMTWAVAAALGFAVMLTLNGLANALPLNGVNTGQLSDEIPNLFVPAGLTFAIWGVIYLLLLGYVAAVFRAAVTPAGKDSWEPADGMLFTVNALLNAAWILSWHWRLVPLSLLIMAGILVTLVMLMERNHTRTMAVRGDSAQGGALLRFFLRVPLLVYLGWICVATIANATALLVTIGWNGFGIPQVVWTVAVIAVGAIVGGALVLSRGAVSAGLVVVWAYAGIIMKRGAVDPATTLPVIVAAWTGIAVVAVAIALRLWTARRGAAGQRG